MGEEARNWRQANKLVSMFADFVSALADHAQNGGTPLSDDFRRALENGECECIQYSCEQSPQLIHELKQFDIDFAEASVTIKGTNGTPGLETKLGFYRKADSQIMQMCIERTNARNMWGPHEISGTAFKYAFNNQEAIVINGFAKEDVAFIKERALRDARMIGVTEKLIKNIDGTIDKNYEVMVRDSDRKWIEKNLDKLDMVKTFSQGEDYLYMRQNMEDVNRKVLEKASSAQEPVYVISATDPYKYILVTEDLIEQHRIVKDQETGDLTDKAAIPIARTLGGASIETSMVRLDALINNWMNKPVVIEKSRFTDSYKEISYEELTKMARAEYAATRQAVSKERTDKMRDVSIPEQKVVAINTGLALYETFNALRLAREEANKNIALEIERRKDDLREKGAMFNEDEKRALNNKIMELDRLKSVPLQFNSTDRYNHSLNPDKFFGMAPYENYLSVETLRVLESKCSVKNTIFQESPEDRGLTGDRLKEAIRTEGQVLKELESTINKQYERTYTTRDERTTISMTDMINAFSEARTIKDVNERLIDDELDRAETDLETAEIREAAVEARDEIQSDEFVRDNASPELSESEEFER